MPDTQRAFVDWFIDRGGYVNSKISLLHDIGNGDRTVWANEAIDEGEQLLLVPVQSTLHLPAPPKDTGAPPEEPSCSATAVPFLSQQQQQQLSPFLKTSMLLLAEMAKGTDSEFAPYIRELPSQSDCLLHWGEEDLALLTGTSIGPQGRALQQLFNEVVAPVLAAAPDLFPPPFNSFEQFRHAADMTQTRAFHMVEENWVTGVSQENAEELYLIPAIDMLNHCTDPAKRNTQLLRFSAGTPLPLEGGKMLSSKGFFTMKADRAIAAGEPILHTYGDLSDAQLLLTYGFVEQLPETNPHNYALLPFQVLEDAVQQLPDGLVELSEGQLARKVQYLVHSGLLQGASPRETQFVLTAKDPLPDEMLTALQVLLMSEEELEQLQQHQQQEAAAAATEADPSSSKPKASAASGSSSSGAAGGGPVKAPRLSLGTELLDGAFGELAVGALVHALELVLSNYPTTAAEDKQVMDSQDSGSRAWRAAAVARGEKSVLMAVRMAALQLLLQAEGSDDLDLEDALEDELEDEDEDEDSLEDEEEDEDEEEEEQSGEQGGLDQQPAAAAAAAGKRGSAAQRQGRGRAAAAAPAAKKAPAAAATGQSKKAKRGLGYVEEEQTATAAGKQEQQQQQGGKQHKRHKHHHHTHHHNHKEDQRAHFGAMTGPAEEDVWQSDDSDKVGYSGSEGEGAAGGAAAADDDGGGGGGGGAARGSRRSRRLAAAAADKHRYEVAADGAVHEVHGHMVGPDEADLVESDDSDKVGYA